MRASAGLHFVDIAERPGLRFTHYSGALGRKYLPETLGAGAVFLDIDGDGWQDLLLVNGTDWPHRQGPRRTPAGLYRNDGRGGFVDATAGSGLDVPIYKTREAVLAWLLTRRYSKDEILTLYLNETYYGDMAYGIQLNATVSYDPTRHAGSEFAESHNWVIAHNTIAYNRYRSAIVIWRSLSNNTTIENNIFYENGVTEGSSSANGVNFLSATPTGVVIRNNLSYASGSGATIFITPGSAVEGVNYTQSNNLVNSTYAPAFVNGGANSLPASPDWTLTS